MDRRDEIAKAAYEVVGKQGLERLNHREVAKKLKINHATVHYYCKTREDLLVSVADHALGQLDADRAKMRAGESSQDLIEAEIALTEAYARSDSRFGKVLLGLSVAAVDVKALRKPLKELWSSWQGVISEHLSKAKTRKGSPFADPAVLSSALFGVVAASHIGGGAKPAEQLDAIYASLFK